MQCHRPSDHGTELQPLQPVHRAKGQNYLKGTAIGDASYFGPELEHFVFNEVHYDQSTNYGYYEIDAIEANWNAAKKNGPSLGHKLRPKEGYFPVPPRAPTWCRFWKKSALRSRPTTMKSRPAARERTG